MNHRHILVAVVCAMTLVHNAGAADLALPNALVGKPLRYLIGADGNHAGEPGTITEVGYDAARKPRHGIGVKYANLFDEKNSGRYGPYLEPSDTAAQYSEGQIDPPATAGAGTSPSSSRAPGRRDSPTSNGTTPTPMRPTICSAS